MTELMGLLIVFSLFAALLLSTEWFVTIAHVYVEDCRQWWRQHHGLLGPGPWRH